LLTCEPTPQTDYPIMLLTHAQYHY